MIDLIDVSPPIRWVGWYMDMDDGPDKEIIKDVLFEGESLRRLTDPKVKQRLTEAAKSNAEYLTLILYGTVGDQEIPPAAGSPTSK
jgi:hypothetical protein